MIERISPEAYPILLDIQTECIRSLDETYSPEEIESWVGYLEEATPERFAAFENRAWLDERGAVEGFVSWTADHVLREAALECLYVREVCRGQGIGRLLLQGAEQSIIKDTVMQVRSTLNARAFYERNGYLFKEQGVSRAGFSMVILDKIIT